MMESTITIFSASISDLYLPNSKDKGSLRRPGIYIVLLGGLE